MIKDVKDSGPDFKLAPITGKTSRFVQNLQKTDNIEISVINNQLYKYGDNNKEEDTKSSYYG